MAKLFIANLTRQHVEFAYRLPESSGIRTQHIRIGQQIPISGDLSSEDIRSIIEQHTKYGLIPASEVKNMRTFCGLCYSEGVPVPGRNIEMGLHNNTVVLLDRGEEQRRRVAIASNNALENNITEHDYPAHLKALNVDIVEQENKNPSELDGKPVAEAFKVTREGGPSAPPPRARARSRGRAA